MRTALPIELDDGLPIELDDAFLIEVGSRAHDHCDYCFFFVPEAYEGAKAR